MPDKFFTATKCARCGGSLDGGRIMSRFNEDVLCLDCEREERQHPDYQKAADASDVTIKTYTDKDGNEVANNKSDGVYALAIVPVVKNKLMAKARYDLYRPTASSVAAKTNYEVGLNYRFCKYLELQTEYCLTNDKALAKHNYSTVFVQFSIRY